MQSTLKCLKMYNTNKFALPCLLCHFPLDLRAFLAFFEYTVFCL